MYPQPKKLAEFTQKIGYTFKNEMLITTALTHSSYANEWKRQLKNNERLEFLGDSVLSLVVAEHLFENYKHLPEGELTKLRASLVCEKSLHTFAKQLGLGSMLLLGKGEEHTGGRERPSILADAFEAVIAAVYLDGGFEDGAAAARHLVELVCRRAHGVARRRAGRRCNRCRRGAGGLVRLLPGDPGRTPALRAERGIVRQLGPACGTEHTLHPSPLVFPMAL